MTSNEHPSYFELDRFALGTADETTEAHVARCARCTAYLESVQSTDMPMPIALHLRRRSPGRMVALGLAVPLLAAAAVLLMLRFSQVPELAVSTPPADPYVGVRGTPAIGVYVRRAEGITLWDGTTHFQPGDTIRIKVIPEGFTYVQVFAMGAAGATRLYGGALVPDDAGESLLPPAWEVDAENTNETLVVVLSKSAEVRLPEGALTRDQDGRTLWVRRFVLVKSR